MTDDVFCSRWVRLAPSSSIDGVTFNEPVFVDVNPRAAARFSTSSDCEKSEFFRVRLCPALELFGNIAAVVVNADAAGTDIAVEVILGADDPSKGHLT